MGRSCKMTKMHFQLIADIIKELNTGVLERHNIAVEFANVLRRTNSQFDWRKFVEACKTDEEKLVEKDERLENA